MLEARKGLKEQYRPRTVKLKQVWRLGVWAVSWFLTVMAAIVGFAAIVLRELSPDNYAAQACREHAPVTYEYGVCLDVHRRDGFWVPGQWALLVAVVLLFVGFGFLFSWLLSRRSSDAKGASVT